MINGWGVLNEPVQVQDRSSHNFGSDSAFSGWFLSRVTPRRKLSPNKHGLCPSALSGLAMLEIRLPRIGW